MEKAPVSSPPYISSWEAQPVSVPRARAFGAGVLEEYGLSAISHDVLLVLSELATNAIIHARTPFTVALDRRDETLTLRVSDRSPEHPVFVAGGSLAGQGRGLVLVQVHSTDWGVYPRSRGGKTVWASFWAPALVRGSP